MLEKAVEKLIKAGIVAVLHDLWFYIEHPNFDFRISVEFWYTVQVKSYE